MYFFNFIYNLKFKFKYLLKIFVPNYFLMILTADFCTIFSSLSKSWNQILRYSISSVKFLLLSGLQLQLYDIMEYCDWHVEEKLFVKLNFQKWRRGHIHYR